MKTIALTTLSMRASANAVAFDINSYCQQVSDAVGGSYQIMEACIQQELEAKSSLY